MNLDYKSLAMQLDSFQKNYYMISRLGYGSFGYALLAKYKKNISDFFDRDILALGTMMHPIKNGNLSYVKSTGLVAVKVMKTQLPNSADYLRVNEVRFILSIPAHPNLLQIYNLFIDDLSGKLNIVMEPMNQNLYQFIQKHAGRQLSPKVVKCMLTQLLDAILHIHSHGFFHRDVKPENILVSSTSQYFGSKLNIPADKVDDAYVLKLCDYGLAKNIKTVRTLTPYVSTRWYRAPEILLRHTEYSLPIDIWAFASVAVELVNFRPLFCGRNETDQIWQVLKILGHPKNSNRGDIGGKWVKALELSRNLGFTMPYTMGSSIHHILPPQYDDLAEAIKYCFLWDPDARPTAEDLSCSPYFNLTNNNPGLLPTPVSPAESYTDVKKSFNLSPNLVLNTKLDADFSEAVNRPRISGVGHDLTEHRQSQEADKRLQTSTENYFAKFVNIGSDLDSDKLEIVMERISESLYENEDHFEDSFANSSFDSHKIAC